MKQQAVFRQRHIRKRFRVSTLRHRRAYVQGTNFDRFADRRGETADLSITYLAPVWFETPDRKRSATSIRANIGTSFISEESWRRNGPLPKCSEEFGLRTVEILRLETRKFSQCLVRGVAQKSRLMHASIDQNMIRKQIYWPHEVLWGKVELTQYGSRPKRYRTRLHLSG